MSETTTKMNNNIIDDNSNNKNNKPKLVPLPNGPLYLINDPEPKIVKNIKNSRGEELKNIQGVALCRCGASKNKPFCDGSHLQINFRDEVN